MRSNFITLAFGLAFAGMSSAIPTGDTSLFNLLSKRVVSPDNTCGNAYAGANNSYSCGPSNAGGCCSQYGYCGNSTDFCDAGCQSQFGACNAPGPSAPVDNTYQCGPAFGSLSCSGGLCCSQAGYCGNTTDYCDAGCQSSYGACNPNSSTGAGGTCGPNFGNAVCSGNQCCSQAGYCGTTQDYCADPGNCLLGFGRCDSDATPAGPSTANEPRPLKGPVTYTDDIYDCVANNVVALTYDDGPYNYTAQLLDTLKQYGFQATFFITGNNNGKGEIDTTAPYPDLIRRMIAEGHQVASHTWSHYSLSNASHALRVSQMVKNEMALNNIIGMWPTYMRPPYSDCTQASGCWADIQALGYHRVYFDLDTQDYLNPLPSQIQNSKNIVKQNLAQSGVTDFLSIQHDIVQQSVTNLTSYYFDLIKAKGWTGVTVGDCLGDTDRTNWYRSLGSSSSSSSTASSSSSTTTSSSSTRTSTVSTVLTSTSTSKPSTSTSKPPTSTSKPTVPTSTSTSTSTSKPTVAPTSSTKTSTPIQPTPTPAPTCEVKNGNWCGIVDTFTNKAGCDKAVLDCYGNTPRCMAAGWFNLFSCLQWNSICFKLSGYCFRCASGKCSNADFGY